MVSNLAPESEGCKDFQSNLNSGYGLRLNYGNTEDEIDYISVKSKLLYLDVTKRWYSLRTKKVSIYGDLGISGMLRNERDNYWGCFCICFGPENSMGSHRAKEYGGHDYNFKEENYTLFILPGATVDH